MKLGRCKENLEFVQSLVPRESPSRISVPLNGVLVLMSLRTRHRKYGRLNEGEFRSQVQDDRKGNRIICMWCWSFDCIRPTCRAQSAFNLRLGHVE